MGKIITRAAAVAVVALASCVPSPFEKIDMASLPDQSAWPDAHAVVLLDEQDVDYVVVDGETYADVTYHTITRLLRDRGRYVERVGRVYLKSFEDVQSFDTRAITPDGREHRFDKATATDQIAQPEFVLFSDGRALNVRFPALPLGSVVELKMKVRMKDPVRFPFVFGFEDDLPIERSVFKVSFPPEVTVERDAWKRGEKIAFEPVIGEAGGRTTWTFERTKVAALPDEDDAPAAHLWFENVGVRLSKYVAKGAPVDAPKDDAALSAWMDAFVRPGLVRTQEIEALHAELVKGTSADDKVARATRLYAWTQEKVQYCAVAVGDGAWVPHAPSTVADVRYGDCKDKAAVLQQLLDVEGVPSDLATIYSHDGAARPYRFPTLTGNFNHMILVAKLPGGDVILDPTTRTVPFGRLPPGDEGADYLLLTKEGAKIARTPDASVAANHASHEVNVAIAADGSSQGTIRSVLAGVQADNARGALLGSSPQDEDDAVAAWLDLDMSGDLEDVRFEGRVYDGVDRPLVVTARTKGKGAAPGGAGTRLVSASRILGGWTPSVPSGPRTVPLVVGPPKRVATTAHVTLPAGWRVARLPAPAKIERPFGASTIIWSQDGAALKLERTVELRARVFAPEDVLALRTFVEETEAACDAPVVIEEVQQ